MRERYSQASDIEKIVARFGVEPPDSRFLPCYNIAPSQEVPVIVDDGKRHLALFRWGLIPAIKGATSPNKIVKDYV